MHEVSVAESLVESITKEAMRLNAKPLAARISCGQLNPINDEVMQFAFEVAIKGTICEGMTLTVVHISWRATCRDCSDEFDFDVYSPVCPKCGSSRFEMADDTPLQLDEIELDENQSVA
jgi:hydrogenase nickel incorporation protein HypA/HybF